MGTLFYGAARTAVRVDDRTLAHLKVLIVSKLRRNEPFLLTWGEPPAEGHGRTSVWIHPTLDLIFRFDGNRQADLDKELLDKMTIEALSQSGVQVSASMPRIWGQ